MYNNAPFQRGGSTRLSLSSRPFASLGFSKNPMESSGSGQEQVALLGIVNGWEKLPSDVQKATRQARESTLDDYEEKRLSHFIQTLKMTPKHAGVKLIPGANQSEFAKGFRITYSNEPINFPSRKDSFKIAIVENEEMESMQVDHHHLINDKSVSSPFSLDDNKKYTNRDIQDTTSFTFDEHSTVPSNGYNPKDFFVDVGSTTHLTQRRLTLDRLSSNETASPYEVGSNGKDNAAFIPDIELASLPQSNQNNDLENRDQPIQQITNATFSQITSVEEQGLSIQTEKSSACLNICHSKRFKWCVIIVVLLLLIMPPLIVILTKHVSNETPCDSSDC